MKAQQVNFPLDGDTVKISWRLPAKTVSSFSKMNGNVVFCCTKHLCFDGKRKSGGMKGKGEEHAVFMRRSHR